MTPFTTTRRRLLGALAVAPLLISSPLVLPIRGAHAMQTFVPTGGDDTAALQAAINGTQSLEILAGDSVISGTVSVPAQRELVFRKGARLLRGHASAPLLSLGSETLLAGARIEPGVVARTAGPDIKVPASSIRVKLEDTFLLGAHWGIETDCTIFDIDTLEIRDTNAGGVGIVMNQGFDQSIRHFVMDGPASAQAAAGIWFNATGDCMMQDINIMHAGYCVCLSPQSGQVVGNLRISTSCLDSSKMGLLVSPGAGGHVIFVRLTNCWLGNHQLNAALIGGVGAIDGVEFVSCDLVQSGTNGVTKTNAGALHVKVIGGLP